MCSNMFINSDKYLLLFGQPGVAISEVGNLQILGFLLLGSFMIQGNPSSFCVSAFYDAFRCVCPPLWLCYCVLPTKKSPSGGGLVLDTTPACAGYLLNESVNQCATTVT